MSIRLLKVKVAKVPLTMKREVVERKRVKEVMMIEGKQKRKGVVETLQNMTHLVRYVVISIYTLDSTASYTCLFNTIYCFMFV